MNFCTFVLFTDARECDLADRYLNTLSVKALLRAGQVDRAHQIVPLSSIQNKIF